MATGTEGYLGISMVLMYVEFAELWKELLTKEERIPSQSLAFHIQQNFPAHIYYKSKVKLNFVKTEFE